MNIVLWILQVLLAVNFLLHGRLMLVPPTLQAAPASRASGMAYIWAIPPGFRRFIGVAEVLAAIGLILPGLTHILPWLTPLAATGLVIVMISAVIFHVRRREYSNIVFNLVLFALVAFVAYGRFVLSPL
ncbi:MAG TPA: DoxX family protein [Anaerolineae bacterium]|nr:DoxX family protein [Anaerolineae bacterium]